MLPNKKRLPVKLSDVLPELTCEIENALRGDGMQAFADQIMTLTLWNRCRCDDPGCATFFASEKPVSDRQLTRLIPNTYIPGLICIQVQDEIIVCIEMLKRPDLKQRLMDSLP